MEDYFITLSAGQGDVTGEGLTVSTREADDRSVRIWRRTKAFVITTPSEFSPRLIVAPEWRPNAPEKG